MDAKTFLHTYGEAQTEQVANAAGTTLAYFKHFVYGVCTPSRALAWRLVFASGHRMTLECLCPAKDGDKVKPVF